MDNTTRENTPKVGTETVGHGDYPLTKKHCRPAAPAPKLPCIPLLKPDTPRDLLSYVPTATTLRGCPEWAGAARRPPACCRTKQGLAAWKDAIFPQPPPPPPPRVTATRPERDSASQQAADRQQAPGAYRTTDAFPARHAVMRVCRRESRSQAAAAAAAAAHPDATGPPKRAAQKPARAVWELRQVRHPPVRHAAACGAPAWGMKEREGETEGAASGASPAPWARLAGFGGVVLARGRALVRDFVCLPRRGFVMTEIFLSLVVVGGLNRFSIGCLDFLWLIQRS